MTKKQRKINSEGVEAKSVKVVILSATLFISLLYFLNFISALSDDAGTSIDFTYATSTNYSTINTNNSVYWNGYPWSDTRWRLWANHTFNGDILVNGGINSTNLNVDTESLGTDATIRLNSELNYNSCINLTEGGLYGFAICNDGSGVNRFVIKNYNTGFEYFVIDRDDGTIYFNNETTFTTINVNSLNITENITIEGLINGINISEIGGSAGNPFDQSLNTTDNVTFNSINVSNGLSWLSIVDYVYSATGIGNINFKLLTGQSTDDSGFNESIFPIDNGIFLFGNSSDDLYGTYKSPVLFFVDKASSLNAVTLSYDIVGQSFNFNGSTITKYIFDKNVEVTGDIYQSGNQVCDNSNNCGYLTTYTETDPYWGDNITAVYNESKWTGNQTNYYNKSEVDALTGDSLWTNESGVITSINHNSINVSKVYTNEIQNQQATSGIIYNNTLGAWGIE